jgi:hypothetical protein
MRADPLLLGCVQRMLSGSSVRLRARPAPAAGAEDLGGAAPARSRGSLLGRVTPAVARQPSPEEARTRRAEAAGFVQLSCDLATLRWSWRDFMA